MRCGVLGVVYRVRRDAGEASLVGTRDPICTADARNVRLKHRLARPKNEQRRGGGCSGSTPHKKARSALCRPRSGVHLKILRHAA
jgi:hypothetical protein